MLSLDASSGGEGPATSTLTLVLDICDVALGPPVHRRGQVNVGQVSHVPHLSVGLDRAQVSGLELLEGQVGG